MWLREHVVIWIWVEYRSALFVFISHDHNARTSVHRQIVTSIIMSNNIYPVVMSCRLLVRELNSMWICGLIRECENIAQFLNNEELELLLLSLDTALIPSYGLFYNKTLLVRTKPWEKKWDARMIEGKKSGSTTFSIPQVPSFLY